MADAKIRITAQDDSAAAFRKAQANVQALASSAASLAGAFGVGISVAGILSIAKASIDSLDALNDLKDATGASIENISALEDVAARTGTTFETVSTSLVKFNKVLSDAKPGSDAEAALTALGLSAQELKNIDPAEALLRTAKALQGFADDGNKARLTQELFGKSLKEVAPFLKDLAEQGRLVATVTTQQAEEAEKFNKELFALQKNTQDLARALTGSLITALNQTISKFREGASAGKGFFETAANIYANNVRQFYGAAQKPLNTGGATGDFGPGAGGGRGSVNPPLAKPSLPSISGIPKSKGAGKSQKDEISESARALASYVDGLSRTLEANDKLTASEKALNFLRAQGKAGELPQVRELVLGLAQQIDKEQELTEIRKRDLELGEARNKQVADKQKEIEELDDRIADLSGRTDAARKVALTSRLEAQLAAGAVFSAEELDRIVRGIGGVNEQLVETKGIADDLGLSFASAFEDAIVGGKSLGEVLKGLEADILRIITRKLVTEPLGNAVTGALSGGGGFGGIFEDIFGSIFGGGRAVGGPVQAGTPYMVGERGPELIVPRNAGTVIPNNQLGGNTVNFHLVQQFASGTTQQTTLQAAAAARRQLEMAGRNL